MQQVSHYFVVVADYYGCCCCCCCFWVFAKCAISNAFGIINDCTNIFNSNFFDRFLFCFISDFCDPRPANVCSFAPQFSGAWHIMNLCHTYPIIVEVFFVFQINIEFFTHLQEKIERKDTYRAIINYSWQKIKTNAEENKEKNKYQCELIMGCTISFYRVLSCCRNTPSPLCARPGRVLLSVMHLLLFVHIYSNFLWLTTINERALIWSNLFFWFGNVWRE